MEFNGTRIWTKWSYTSESKKGDKDQEWIQSSTTPNPEYHMESDKNIIKHHKQEPKGQPFRSRWPQGSNEQMQKPDKHNT